MQRREIESRLSISFDLETPGKHFGTLRLPWSNNENPLGYYPIPLISFKNGIGPTALIIGGTHGDEFEGPSAVMRLAQKLDCMQISGQIILIPALNMPAVMASSRTSPLDGQNLNRSFPGDPNGGPTAMLADFVERSLMTKCSAVIDLHSGGKAAVFKPCTLATNTQDEALYEKNLKLAEAFGLPLVWKLGQNNDNRSINSAAERVAVPMIAAELGGGGGIDPEITDKTEQGLLNVLKYLEILETAYVKTEIAEIVEINCKNESLYAPSIGLFDRNVSAGQNIVSGELAGYFHYIYEPDRPSLKVRFPKSGFILAHSNRGLVEQGDLLALVAQKIERA